MKNNEPIDPDDIRSALQHKDGIVCVFTADNRRHYVRGYDARIHKLSKCDEILRSDDGKNIYEDINGADCLHPLYYEFCRHPSLPTVSQDEVDKYEARRSRN